MNNLRISESQKSSPPIMQSLCKKNHFEKNEYIFIFQVHFIRFFKHSHSLLIFSIITKTHNNVKRCFFTGVMV